VSKRKQDGKGAGRSKRPSALTQPRQREPLTLPLPEGATLDMLTPDLALITVPLADAQLPAALTDAEQDIALRVYLGHSNQEIAQQRQTSEFTIGNQLEAIYRKLRVSSRTELVLRLRGGRP
jgi:DNA-binding CsgD family transcriptional regulator